MVLESSTPRNWMAAVGHKIALNYFVPLVGRVLSKDPAAYRYLPKTIAAFPQGEEFAALMVAAGCEQVAVKVLRPGVCTVYLGTKP